jgi:hypothetical protein
VAQWLGTRRLWLHAWRVEVAVDGVGVGRSVAIAAPPGVEWAGLIGGRSA